MVEVGLALVISFMADARISSSCSASKEAWQHAGEEVVSKVDTEVELLRIAKALENEPTASWLQRSTFEPSGGCVCAPTLNATQRTCTSLLAAAGLTHLEIARQLGHSPETSVWVYQHLLDVGQGERLSIDEWIVAAREEVAGDREQQGVAE